MAWDLSNYEDVASRVKRFQEAFPMGRIIVRVLDFDKDRKTMLVEAAIYRTDAPDELPAATDIALEWASKSNVSEKWWAENAATSAIGRAISSVLPTEIKATRESMAQVSAIEKEKSDPWAVYGETTSVGGAIGILQNELGAELIEEAPICAHGHMILKKGINAKKEPYQGYVCPEKDRAAQCKAQWMELNSEGRWVL